MKGLLELKNYVGEFTDVDLTKNTVTGYLSVFGNVDHDNEVTVKGAFAKSIKDRGPQGANKIVFLNYHKWDQPHGKFSVLQEDDHGLYFEAKLDPNVSYSKDALIQIQNKVVEELSYGWVTVRDGVKDGVRYLYENYLYEGSNVVLGANDATSITGFKSMTLPEMQVKMDRMVSLLRNGNLTDDGFIQLEIALKQLQLEAYQLGQKNAPTNEQPPKSTDLESTPQKSVNQALYNSLSKIII